MANLRRQPSAASELLLLVSLLLEACDGWKPAGTTPAKLPACTPWSGERSYVIDRDTVDIFVVLDFPRTHPEAVFNALVKVFELHQMHESPTLCMTLTQFIEVSMELKAPVSRERMQAGLHKAQLQRIQKLSAGNPSVAAELYSAAAAVDPHVFSYQLLLGSELTCLGNLTGAASALTAAVSFLQSGTDKHMGGTGLEAGSEDIIRARLGLALVIEALERNGEVVKAQEAGTGGVIEQYQHLLSLHPDAQALWYMLARVLSRTNDSRAPAAMRAASRLSISTTKFSFTPPPTSSVYTHTHTNTHTHTHTHTHDTQQRRKRQTKECNKRQQQIIKHNGSIRIVSRICTGRAT